MGRLPPFRLNDQMLREQGYRRVGAVAIENCTGIHPRARHPIFSLGVSEQTGGSACCIYQVSAR